MITTSSLPLSDRLLGLALRLCGLLAALVLGGIVVVLLVRALPFLINEGAGIWQSTWQPGQGEYGMAPMIAGSLFVSVLALVLAAPVAVLLAAWLRYFAPRLRRPVLAGVELMIVPLALLVTDAALGQLPLRYQRAGEALALSRVGMLRRVLLPRAAPGIVGGVVLQFGRALGETMAVLMVCGNVVQWPDSVFAPVRTLTANIALEMAYATGDHRVALFASGLLLIAVTGLLLMASWRLRGVSHG